MTYIVEPWDGVDLPFSIAPHSVIDPLLVELNFERNFDPLPWLSPSLHAEWRARLQSAVTKQGEFTFPSVTADRADHHSGAVWGQADFTAAPSALLFAAAEKGDAIRAGVWGIAEQKASALTLMWNRTVIADAMNLQSWDQGTAIDLVNYSARWKVSGIADAARSASWFSVNLAGKVYNDAAAKMALHNTDNALGVVLNFSGDPNRLPSPVAVQFAFGYVPHARPSVPHDISNTITARQANPRDAIDRIPWGLGDSVWLDWNLPYPVDPNLPPGPEPGEIPDIKVVYLTMNTLQIETIIGEIPLDVQDVGISLDIDSLSWQFSGTVYGEASLYLIKPDEGGMKEISVTINGHNWLFMIERYTSDEQFPTKKFGITGITRTQYMAAPFAPTRSYTNSGATTAKQAAESELANTGFTLAWALGGDADLPDWTIPAGALSYRDRSPAQVIGQIVKAAGGVMIPSRNSDAWTIQPRYSTPSWQWNGVSPDVVIYIGMVRSRSATFEPGPSFDACYVSGINQGEAVEVRRQGSGGLSPMPDIYDDLITDAQPAISRGKVELSAAGNKVIETLSVLIPENAAAPGIITPGQIAKIIHDDAEQDYCALVLSTRITVQRAGAAEIYQSVTLERAA